MRHGGCTRTLAYTSGARFPYDFADPFVLSAAGTYYGYSTNAGAGDIQVIRSPDLVNWELVGNGLADLPRWAAPNATWAPAVLSRGGGYVAYYTVRDAASQRQCISRAVSGTPAGPFVDDSAGPLVCQITDGGSIDPSPFVDAEGRAFLLWKSEGRGGTPPTIWSQELATDGLALTGVARALLVADREFERGVIEAPNLVQEAGGYYLLYAAADWNSRSYAVAYAGCAGPAGPCVKPADGRVLASGPRAGRARWGRGVPRHRRPAMGRVPCVLGAGRRLPEQPLPPHRPSTDRRRSDRPRRHHVGGWWRGNGFRAGDAEVKGSGSATYGLRLGPAEPIASGRAG